jgi:hypothetical protein
MEVEELMTNLKINGIEYDLSDGFVLNKKYNEELDNATITIPFSDKLNLSPFDFVEIEDERFGTEYFLVDTWVETTVSFNPLKYNYDINLISETIKLQKIVMPNLTITHPIGKEPKPIWKKLEEYYLTYIYPQYNELELDLSIYDLIEDCPEGEFNRPTAFEVFNTLLGKVNGVVRVHNHKIGFLRLDQYGDEIDESKLYYNNDTQTIKDYADRLDVQVSNGITEKKNFASLSGITVRGGEGQAVVNDDNMLILLEKPIYDLSEEADVYVYIPYKDTVENNKEITGIARLRITDRIVEKAVYDTYKVSSSQIEVSSTAKRNNLYYVRGQNTIEGLNYNESTILGFSTNSALYNIIDLELGRQISSTATPNFAEAQMRKNVYFRLEYKTNESFRFVVEKDNDYNATLVDNQTETQVDILNFGKVEQDKLNRLGNKNQIITATYMYDEKIPKLGDYIGRYVLAQTEVVYYKDYALFKGYLYKDFVRKNMFYGLNSKKRSTQIATESVVRNDVFNYDVTFHLERQRYDYFIRYVLMPLSVSGYPDMGSFEGYDYYEYPKYCVFQIHDENNDPILDYKVLVTPSSFVCGKSNVIQFQMMDNYSAGIRVADAVTGGNKQEYVKYTNDYGEFKGFNAYICSNKREDLVEKATTIEELQSYRELLNDLPMLKNENANKISANFLFAIGKPLYKDNRETTAITLNINYKDSPNVIVGDFARYTGIGYRYNIAYYNIGIMYSTVDEYEIGDAFGIGIEDDSLKLDWHDGVDWMVSNGETNTLDNLSLNLNGKDTSQWKSWAIVEKDTGRLILGVNKANEKTIPTTIYLKFEEKPY